MARSREDFFLCPDSEKRPARERFFVFQCPPAVVPEPGGTGGWPGGRRDEGAGFSALRTFLVYPTQGGPQCRLLAGHQKVRKAHTANAQRAKRHRAVAGRVFKQTRPGFVWVGALWVGAKARYIIDKKSSTVNCQLSLFNCRFSNFRLGVIFFKNAEPESAGADKGRMHR